MNSAQFDDDWFARARGVLLQSAPAGLPRQTTVALLLGGRFHGNANTTTETVFSMLAPRHGSAARAHLQLYRAALLVAGVLASDDLVNAAVQVEWLWYTTPFKKFYRDHLAHVLKVATTGLWLLEDGDSPFCPLTSTPFVDWIAREMAARRIGSSTLRAAARRRGVAECDLATKGFWQTAILSAYRVAALLHDIAYPDMMAGKVQTAATPVRRPIPLTTADGHRAADVIAALSHRLVLAPFFHGELPPVNLEIHDSRLLEAECVYRDSHSLRAGALILDLLDGIQKLWSLEPVHAFALEWAALAASLHDYDKQYEIAPTDSPLKEHLRPRFQRDPVSYLLAFCDQLQDFGRPNYRREDTPSSQITLHVRYPCKEVRLEILGDRLPALAKIEFVLESLEPFAVTDEERNEIANSKLPGGISPIFGEGKWLDHTGLFDSVSVSVS